MNDFVKLSKKDYASFLPIDVAAFHYSGLGACGRPGVIRIITRDKRKYEIDYTELPREIVFSICPPFAAICQAAANDYPLPVGWMRLNMGLGNSLYMTSELRQNISVADLCPPEIYQRWVPMIIETLYRIENGIVLDVSIEDVRVTPNHIETLNDNEIFVFGSNIFGCHDGGASETALLHFGARYGQKEGLQGQSYAIPTDGIPYMQIRSYVYDFIQFAQAHPEHKFLVTRIGCGTAGYDVSQIAPMFERAKYISNISLPLDFWKFLL